MQRLAAQAGRRTAVRVAETLADVNDAEVAHRAGGVPDRGREQHRFGQPVEQAEHPLLAVIDREFAVGGPGDQSVRRQPGQRLDLAPQRDRRTRRPASASRLRGRRYTGRSRSAPAARPWLRRPSSRSARSGHRPGVRSPTRTPLRHPPPARPARWRRAGSAAIGSPRTARIRPARPARRRRPARSARSPPPPPRSRPASPPASRWPARCHRRPAPSPLRPPRPRASSVRSICSDSLDDGDWLTNNVAGKLDKRYPGIGSDLRQLAGSVRRRGSQGAP